jgi:hypothetical protein
MDLQRVQIAGIQKLSIATYCRNRMLLVGLCAEFHSIALDYGKNAGARSLSLCRFLSETVSPPTVATTTQPTKNRIGSGASELVISGLVGVSQSASAIPH